MYIAKIVDFEFWSFPVLKLLGNGCTWLFSVQSRLSQFFVKVSLRQWLYFDNLKTPL